MTLLSGFLCRQRTIALNLERFRISQVWNSGVFVEDLQADTFSTALNLERFRISQVGIVEFSQWIYKPTPFPTALNLDLFRISQVWNSRVFAVELQADTLSDSLELGAFSD